MNLELSIHATFGNHLSDGEKATEFRMGRVDPYVAICEQIIFDFSNVRNANSSFINALVAGLIEQHGLQVLKVISFKSCNDAIRVLIISAVELGARKAAGKVIA